MFARRAPLTDSVAAADRRRRGDGLWQAMARFGGPSRFAADYGLPLAPARGGLDDAAVREQLRAALRASNLLTWPSRAWLIARAGAELAAAVERTGGPRRWADELGLPRHHRHRQRWTAHTIAVALGPLLAGRATWPNRREFEASGLAGLYATITQTEGHAAMARRYGLALQRPRRRRTPPRRVHHELPARDGRPSSRPRTPATASAGRPGRPASRGARDAPHLEIMRSLPA